MVGQARRTSASSAARPLPAGVPPVLTEVVEEDDGGGGEGGVGGRGDDGPGTARSFGALQAITEEDA